MTRDDIKDLVDHFIVENDVEQNETTTIFYLLQVYSHLSRCELNWNELLNDNNDVFKAMMFLIHSVDENLNINFYKDNTVLHFIIGEDPETTLQAIFDSEYSYIEIFHILCEYYFELLIDRRNIAHNYNIDLPFISEIEMPSIDFEAPLEDFEKLEIKYSLYELSEFLKKFDKRKRIFYQAIDILRVGEDRDKMFYDEVERILNSENVYEDEKKFDEWETFLMKKLGELENHFTKTFNENYSSFASLHANILELDGSFDIAFDNNEIKFILQENPEIYLDSPLLNGESKYDRLQKVMNIYVRIEYLVSALSAADAVSGGKTNYENLNDREKKLYEAVTPYIDDDENEEEEEDTVDINKMN